MALAYVFVRHVYLDRYPPFRHRLVYLAGARPSYACTRTVARMHARTHACLVDII